MTNENIRILILVPGQNARGGITNYYQTLWKYFKLPIDYYERGSRNWPKKISIPFRIMRTMRDMFFYVKKIRTGNYGLIQTTTSFSAYSMMRDAIFIIIAKYYKIKTVVFFHGWNPNYLVRFEKRYIWFFKYIYLKTDAIIDLSQDNINKILQWGYKNPIYIETTVVDNDLVKNITPQHIIDKFPIEGNKIKLLFLARLEKEKGLYETIDSYFILKKAYPNISLTIAGDGSEELKAKEYVENKNLKDVVFKGFISGKDKIQVLKEAHIYILPSYEEGMPTSLLEAMAFGLPIITRPVGGIPDFFKTGIHGYLSESKDPTIIASLIEKLLQNHYLMKQIALINLNYAHERFLSNLVVERMEEIFTKILNN